jgi:hypothetical protein
VVALVQVQEMALLELQTLAEAAVVAETNAAQVTKTEKQAVLELLLFVT